MSYFFQWLVKFQCSPEWEEERRRRQDIFNAAYSLYYNAVMNLLCTQLFIPNKVRDIIFNAYHTGKGFPDMEELKEMIATYHTR